MKSGKMAGTNEVAKIPEVICLDNDLQSESSQAGRSVKSGKREGSNEVAKIPEVICLDNELQSESSHAARSVQ